jgi:Zn-dependent peptidase ImmA (M78 family)/DNA-binding XRE family transcriptional regulator
MNKIINKEMIILARESRGFTQSDLAKLISTPQSKISRIESGLLGISEEMLKEISQVLKYPESFFYFTDQLYGAGISSMGILYHRSRQNLSSKLVNQIYAQINIRRIHLSKLLKAVEIENKFRYFEIDEFDGKVEKIAQQVRASWFIQNGPIKNLTRAIEDAGGIIIEFDFGTKTIDAISQWLPDMPPLFFVNKNSFGDRLRFSLAHELGHIFMHKNPNPDMEKQADLFAGEFLMPRGDIASSFTFVTLPALANLKPYWKVSMQALLCRASDLRKVSARQKQYLWMQIGKAGYRMREPPELDIPREQPTLLQEIIQKHQDQLKYSKTELCELLGVYEDELSSIYCHDEQKPKRHLTLVK